MPPLSLPGDSFLEWRNEPLALPEGKGEATTAGRSDEEIKAFTVRCFKLRSKGEVNLLAISQVDERLSDVERVIIYLNGGQLIQQRQAITR